MPLRPPCRKRPLPARAASPVACPSAPSPATPLAPPNQEARSHTEPRRTRPVLERSGPLRSWPVGPSTGAVSPAEEAVSTAYEVFDRYLDEGRKYAAGRSAWYADNPDQTSGLPAPNRLASALMHGDLANALSRVIQDVAHLARDLTDAIALRPSAVASRAAGSNGRPFHPQQHPDYRPERDKDPVWKEASLQQPPAAPVEPPPPSQQALADRLAARPLTDFRWSQASDPRKQ